MRTHLFLTLTSLIFVQTGFAQQVESPIFFRENKGQVINQYSNARPDVLFSGNAGGLTFHLLEDGVQYQITRIIDSEKKSIVDARPSLPDHPAPSTIEICRVDIHWKNTSDAKQIESGSARKSLEHYYVVPEGTTEPILGVQCFDDVTYRNLYTGIDLLFHSKNGHLESDFMVAPGADYTQIKWTIEGAEVRISDKNELILSTPFGDIVEGSLRVFQHTTEIEARWVYDAAQHSVGFDIPEYDPSQPLRIDPPILLWGSYLGGTGVDQAHAVCTDSEDNVYFAGSGFSETNIATDGAFVTVFESITSAMLAKFSNEGARIWSTYYPGFLRACTTDSDNAVYVGGSATQNPLATTEGAYQEIFGLGDTDGIFAKFNSDGTRAWGSYFGGINGENVLDMAVSNDGHLYLTGSAFSSEAVATPGAFQETFGGGYDGFISKFTTDGDIVWSTYYGGSDNDGFLSVIVDNAGDILVAGESSSPESLATPGVHQTQMAGDYDGIIIKFNPEGQRIWATYLGGTGNDYLRSIDVDPSDHIYATGTAGPTGISTPGAHVETVNFSAGTLTKFAANGTRVWGTYLSPSDSEGFSCKVNNAGKIFVAGTTSAFAGIATPGAYLEENATGTPKAYLMKFTTDGIRDWGTYYGGDLMTRCYKATLLPNDHVYMVGETFAPSGIATSGAHQEILGGSRDAYIVKFDASGTSIHVLEQSAISFDIFPNPAHDQFQLRTQHPGEFDLLDISGKRVRSFRTTQPTTVINAPLAAGIYFLREKSSGYALRLVVE